MPSFHDFRFLSTDGKHKVFARECTPDGEVRAVLQIAHGVAEHVYRYAPFMEFLANNGFVVVANDHLGHGLSAEKDADTLYFGPRDGWMHVVDDMYALRCRTKEKYPNVPYFLMGHSMGSFVIRNYIQRHAEGLRGAVVMGTGNQPRVAALAGRAVSGFLMKTKGPRYRSPFVDSLALGGLNKPFKPARTKNDFISSDPQVVDRYCANPLCSFTFTVSAYHDMFGGMLNLSDRGRLAGMPRTLPVLLASGGQDPLGDMGKGIEKLLRTYQDLGMQDVTLRLYPGDRHEILNEQDRETVYADVAAWLESKLLK